MPYMNSDDLTIHVNAAAKHGGECISPLQPVVDLILAGYAVEIDDGPATLGGRRYRYLWVNGAQIGMRADLKGIAGLAKRCNGLDADGLRALQSAEMDREDAAKADPTHAINRTRAVRANLGR